MIKNYLMLANQVNNFRKNPLEWSLCDKWHVMSFGFAQSHCLVMWSFFQRYHWTVFLKIMMLRPVNVTGEVHRMLLQNLFRWHLVLTGCRYMSQTSGNNWEGKKLDIISHNAEVKVLRKSCNLTPLNIFCGFVLMIGNIPTMHKKQDIERAISVINPKMLL